MPFTASELLTVAIGALLTCAALGYLARAILRGGAQPGDAAVRTRLVQVEGKLFAEVTIDNQNDSAATVSAKARATSPLTALFDLSRHASRTPSGTEALGTVEGRGSAVYLVAAPSRRAAATRVSVVVERDGYRAQVSSTTRHLAVARPSAAPRTSRTRDELSATAH